MTEHDLNNNAAPTAAETSAGVTRRDFIRTAAAAGAGLMLGQVAMAQAAPAAAPASAPAAAGAPAVITGAAAPEIKVGIVGIGRQGYNLINNALKIPGVRFVAVCDIWPWRAERAANLLGKYKQQVKVYGDHKEMLAGEAALDAVLVATPDWMHSPQTVDCLQAGKHVYCEKMMSNTVEGAKAMVLAARASGKRLQIGHQRRSEPRYMHAIKLIENDKILGRPVRCEGQWARPVQQNEGWPKGKEVPADVLAKYGYDSMEQLVNWHWFKKYSGGPICDLGAHQIDVFNWFLKTNPSAVMANGGNDYYPGREWYDNVMALFEYPTPQGMVRASYLLSNSNGHGDFWEQFRGDEGTLQISENEKIGNFWKEPVAKTREWEEHSEKTEAAGKEGYTLKVGETLDPSGKPTAEAQKLLAESKKFGWQLHLENFVDAIRDPQVKLNCPPEVAFQTAVTVMKVNEALEKGARVEYKPEEFTV